MKKSIVGCLALFVLGISCEKDNIVTNVDYPPLYGVWKSIAQYDGQNWIKVAQPHSFEFKNESQQNFVFIDHNSVACTGNYSFKVEGVQYFADFPTSSCGLTKREIKIVSQNSIDTIELIVVKAPNITPERVRYTTN